MKGGRFYGMRDDILFMPLGGGQRTGASCYYLKLGSANIILDAGNGNNKGIIFEPDLHSLVTSPYIQSINQINQIFISHAHYDHIGYLFKLMKEAARANVYMTRVTKLLSGYQLYDKAFLSGKRPDENKRLAAQYMLDRVSNVDFMQCINFGTYKASFWQAGHIPGAMMVLFEYGRRKILYTGDYSLKSTPLAGGCVLPDNAGIDTVIMCGLHAKHPGYIKNLDNLFIKVQHVLNIARQHTGPVVCYVPQLSKGIEFIKVLNMYNENNIPVYIDNSVMRIIEKMEKLAVPVLNENNKVFDNSYKREPYIYVTADKEHRETGFCHYVNVDFSLHEDFREMKEFIKKINPRQAVMVHCAREHSPYDETIEQVLMLDGESRTQFIFAEEKEIYRI